MVSMYGVIPAHMSICVCFRNGVPSNEAPIDGTEWGVHPWEGVWHMMFVGFASIHDFGSQHFISWEPKSLSTTYTKHVNFWCAGLS